MKINLKIPQSYNNLSNGQFIQLVKLLYSGKSGYFFDFCCLKILLNLRWFQITKHLKLAYTLTQVPMSELKKHFDWVYTKNDRTIFPPKINNYFAPQDKITNLTAQEFAVAETLHIRWRETKQKDFLIYLAAVLYSKTKQPREFFDKNSLHDKSKHFKKVPLPVLLAVELAYFGSKNNLVKRFPQAFPTNGPQPKTKNYGFSKVILQMSGGKFGNHEETKATNIYTFLEEFEQNLKDAKDAKKNT